MINLHDQTIPLGTFALIGLIALAVLAVPLYWKVIPQRRRRETHILVSALVLIAVFPLQAPALLLAAGWSVFSVWRLRSIYERRNMGVARPGAPGLSAAASPRSQPGPVPGWIILLHLLPLLAVFVQVKLHVYALIGYSYFLLRTIHLFVEAGRQRRFPADPLDVAHYLLFLPAFFSGPIDRLPRFRETAVSHLSRQEALEGLYRLGLGLVRKFVFGAAFFLWYQYLHLIRAQLGTFQVWVMYNVFLVYVFFDFAGYTDIAIGLGRLYGWRLCENFNYPFLARNSSQYWRSWHMSFTFWLQDYIFTPVARWMTLHLKGKPQTRVILAMIPAAVCTMMAAGLWHYIHPSMLIWGAAQGAGILAGVVYAAGVKRLRLGEAHEQLGNTIPYRALCAALVIEYQCLLIPFVMENLPTAGHTIGYMLGICKSIGL